MEAKIFISYSNNWGNITRRIDSFRGQDNNPHPERRRARTQGLRTYRTALPRGFPFNGLTRPIQHIRHHSAFTTKSPDIVTLQRVLWRSLWFFLIPAASGGLLKDPVFIYGISSFNLRLATKAVLCTEKAKRLHELLRGLYLLSILPHTIANVVREPRRRVPSSFSSLLHVLEPH